MRKSLLAFALLNFLLLCPQGSAQEEKESTPSQKTKEAIEKFKKAPGAVAKGLETLKDAGRAKVQEVLGGKAPTKAEKAASVVPTKKTEPAEAPRYSASGKRDTFRPLALKTKVVSRPRENISPLERIEIGQLKLVGVVWDVKEPKAMVEDALGLGYIVKVGTPIGPNEGKVKEIKPAEVIIEETYADFYGERKRQQTSMKLEAELGN